MTDVLPLTLALLCGLALVLVLFALWQSLRGLFAGAGWRPGAGPALGVSRAALEHEKAELLAALRELRFEHELGKLSQADFAKLEQRYRSRAREVLRELDRELDPYRVEARTLIAAAVGQAVAVKTPPAKADEHDRGLAPQGLACAGCGVRNDADAVFCKKCGARVRSESSL